jgi:hypothetical protein
LKGLVGITPANQWFVVVGSFGGAQAAIDNAKEINVSFPGKYQPIKSGGDESESAVTVVCHSSGAKARRENEILFPSSPRCAGRGRIANGSGPKWPAR